MNYEVDIDKFYTFNKPPKVSKILGKCTYIYTSYNIDKDTLFDSKLSSIKKKQKELKEIKK